MTELASGNKRIAKNTLLLYLRMIFMMVVTLYTSRVVLATLGEADYGIYSVVGGFIIMFGFLNSAMSSATSRYLTFALGKGMLSEQRKVFSTSVQIHLAIALLVVLLCETAGLWFLEHYIVVDASRRDAAFWVFQCSVLTMSCSIVNVPFNAAIIANERMSAFAYISIAEVSLKLLVVYLLVLSPADKLVVYAFLLLLVQLCVLVVYIAYCRLHFPEVRLKWRREKTLMREMVAFAGWNLMGNCANVLSTQGVNVLLNLFFTPVVNAARAVAVQAQAAVVQFSVNFQMALNPQITKRYARGEMEEMYALVVAGSRFSFFLLFALSLPILLMTPEILALWLGRVPAYSAVFLQISLCVALIDGMANPLMTAASATGHVQRYQTVVGGIIMLIAPLSYVVLKLGCPPPAVFLVHLFISFVALSARLVILRSLIGLSIRRYLSAVVRSAMAVVLAGAPLPVAARYFISPVGLPAIFLLALISLLSVATATYFFGITKQERAFVREKVARRFLRK